MDRVQVRKARIRIRGSGKKSYGSGTLVFGPIYGSLEDSSRADQNVFLLQSKITMKICVLGTAGGVGFIPNM
jgi:hypothetical protein